jgi:hypothetical protein
MVLLGDEAQVEARFSLFGNSANLDSKGHVESCFGPFGDDVCVGAR